MRCCLPCLSRGESWQLDLTLFFLAYMTVEYCFFEPFSLLVLMDGVVYVGNTLCDILLISFLFDLCREYLLKLLLFIIGL